MRKQFLAFAMTVAVLVGAGALASCNSDLTAPKPVVAEKLGTAHETMLVNCIGEWWSNGEEFICNGPTEWCYESAYAMGECEFEVVYFIMTACDAYGGDWCDGGGDGDPPPSTVFVTLSQASTTPGGQVTVTAYVLPALPGQAVTLSAVGVNGTGGHVHTSPARPSGTLWQESGSTNADGFFQTTYLASPFGGDERIKVQLAGLADSVTLIVQVAGLQQMTQTTGDSLIGHKQGLHHIPNNHYGTANANAKLVLIGAAYAAKYPGSKLLYNDQSLPRGGLFDISGHWTSPHQFHRDGRTCDVDDNTVPEVRWPAVVQMFKDNGVPAPSHETAENHWHITFTS